MYTDFSKKFLLYTGASDYSLGYILGRRDEQGRERVIAYGGRALTPNEVKFPVTHKEALAIISGICNFHVYLAKSKFTVYTDHAALSSLPINKHYEGRLARWALFLQQYDYTVQAKKGKQNANADFLSRIHYPQCSRDPPSSEYVPPQIMSNNHFPAEAHTTDHIPEQNAPSYTTEYTLHYTTHSNEHATTNTHNHHTVNPLTKLLQAENEYQSVKPIHYLCEVLQTTETDKVTPDAGFATKNLLGLFNKGSLAR